MSADGQGITTILGKYMSGELSRRNFMIRAGQLGLTVAAAGTALAACAPASSGGGDAVEGGTFREGYNRDFTPPDPVANAWADPTFNAFFEPVVARDDRGVLVPVLADSFDWDETGWRFTMREGLTFHSGAAVTAAVVAANFDVFREAGVGQNAGFWNPITAVTVDGDTVECATDGPFGAFTETIGTEYCYIFNPEARDAAGENWGSQVIDGTGPFELVSFSPGDRVVSRRWDSYPGSPAAFLENHGVAHVEGIEWVAITQASQRAPEIETGNVDAVKNPPPQDIDRLKGNPDLVVQEFQELSNFFLSLNLGRTELGFDDVRVRQAISHAIDREGIVKSIFLGHAAATYGPVMPGNIDYEAGVEKFNQYDPDRSRSLLDEAGWTPGADGVRAKDGNRLSFEIVNLTDTTENQVMQTITQMLGEVGVELKVNSLQGAAFFPYLAPTTPAFAFKWLWSSPINVIEIFGTAFQGVNTPDTDRSHELYAAWQKSASDDELTRTASEYQLFYAENLLLIPIYTPNTVWVNRTNVTGWTPNQVNLYPFYNDVRFVA